MKLNYIVIPLIVFLVALAGSLLTSKGMDWYKTLTLPVWTPSGFVIGLIWTIIFILSAISAILVWNGFSRGVRFNLIIVMFLVNAALNVLWSYLFFGKHLFCKAVVDAGFLSLSVFILIILINPVRKAAILLYPYFFWTVFATYLAFKILILNF